MSLGRFPGTVVSVLFAVVLLGFMPAISAGQSSTSSSTHSRRVNKTESSSPVLDAGAVSNGVYRNLAFGFACKVPAGWVFRTDEMNAQEQSKFAGEKARESVPGVTDERGCRNDCGSVLLAAFSRPPEAHGEDVNSSILIAAESEAMYPGLKEAAQYFDPLTEVAKAQGFETINEPYEFEVGAKKLARSDFQKDVGDRVLRQSTLVMLKSGYAVSFTFIGGTEEEVEDLVQGLTFIAANGSAK